MKLKNTLFLIAFLAINYANSQNVKNVKKDSLMAVLDTNINTQLELLHAYNSKLGDDILKIKNRKGLAINKHLNVSEKIPKKISPVGVEVVVGITDNEGIGFHANINFEIEEKNNGIEMGVFYDSNDLLTQDLEVPSEIFIINFGYTKQINFLSNKETISTRAVLGGAIGAENLNNSKDELSTGELIKTEDGLIYGGYAGIFSRFKINNRFSILIRNSSFFTTSDVSLHKFIIGGGLRYNF